MSLTSTEPLNCESTEIWFDGFISELRAHEIMLKTGVATEEMRSVYNIILSGRDNDIYSLSRQVSSRYFLKLIVTDFLSEIDSLKEKIINIAIRLTNTRVSVWFVINDNDEDTEDGIILAEAKINAKYSEYSFYIDSMIVVKSDNYPIPQHYQIFS